MRPLLKYGIPAAAGLATGGYAYSQGEDPGTSILAGTAGALGGAAGLLGARKLAGKYAPLAMEAAQQSGISGQETFLNQAAKMREGGLRQKVFLDLADAAGGIQVPTKDLQRAVGRPLAAGLVPAGALAAGLGGVALGAIPSAMGVPGFTDQRIDPESYGSSNSPGARYKQTTGTSGISNYQR